MPIAAQSAHEAGGRHQAIGHRHRNRPRLRCQRSRQVELVMDGSANHYRAEVIDLVIEQAGLFAADEGDAR